LALHYTPHKLHTPAVAWLKMTAFRHLSAIGQVLNGSASHCQELCPEWICKPLSGTAYRVAGLPVSIGIEAVHVQVFPQHVYTASTGVDDAVLEEDVLLSASLATPLPGHGH
jgi:hypothetical protein